MGEFKNVFKALREAIGLTQSQMAEQIGISRSTIGMYETGAREPDFETLEKIADFFNVDIDYLIGRTNKTTFLPQSAGGYYLDPKTAQKAQELFSQKEMQILFDAAQGSKPENLMFAAEMLSRMKETNPDG